MKSDLKEMGNRLEERIDTTNDNMQVQFLGVRKEIAEVKRDIDGVKKDVAKLAPD